MVGRAAIASLSLESVPRMQVEQWSILAINQEVRDLVWVENSWKAMFVHAKVFWDWYIVNCLKGNRLWGQRGSMLSVRNVTLCKSARLSASGHEVRVWMSKRKKKKEV